MKNILNNKTILITGGTGSFGKKLTEVLLNNKKKPNKIIIYSRDEFKQSEMKKKFSSSQLKFLRFFIGDVRDLNRLKIALNGVDLVVHAAALKQVDTAEYNPQEFVKTNVVGAENLIEACLNSKVSRLIALSTDKAANPVNLYGATKLVSDKLFIAANNLVGNKNLSFSIVRYGNVLNSRGSIVPLIKSLSKTKSAIPITDEKMTRFWITLNQSVEFVLSCINLMKGGEIFVPKIPSVKIIDLPKVICPNNKIKIIGLRPGEKIHEILCSNENYNDVYEFKKFFVIKPSIQFNKLKTNYKIYNKEIGKKVPYNFEYSSGKNNRFLSLKEIKKLSFV